MRWSSTDRESQLGHFREADDVHFRWQTEGGYFADTERELLESAGLPTSGSLLEIGCGEGGNLFHLGARDGWVGIDFAQQKLAHASACLPRVSFVCGDAGRLPFRDGAFDAILIRDVLHHVPDRETVLAEAWRVLAPGGSVAVIEPNRNNPMIAAFALLVRAERASIFSTERLMRAELSRAGFVGASIARAQPFPLARVALHPALGTSRYGKSAWVTAALRAADRVAERVVNRAIWMYLVGSAQKPDTI